MAATLRLTSRRSRRGMPSCFRGSRETQNPETRNPPGGAGHMPAGAGKDRLWRADLPRKPGLPSSWKCHFRQRRCLACDQGTPLRRVSDPEGRPLFVEQLRRAVEASPRVELAKVASLLWKAYAAGQVSEDQASELSEMIEAGSRNAAVRASKQPEWPSWPQSECSGPPHRTRSPCPRHTPSTRAPTPSAARHAATPPRPALAGLRTLFGPLVGRVGAKRLDRKPGKISVDPNLGP